MRDGMGMMLPVAALALTACTSDELGTAPGAVPTPEAGVDELVAFCERYHEVQHEDLGTIFEALLEVGPADLEQPLIRLTSGPSDSYNDDRAMVEEFLDRCEG